MGNTVVRYKFKKNPPRNCRKCTPGLQNSKFSGVAPVLALPNKLQHYLVTLHLIADRFYLTSL